MPIILSKNLLSCETLLKENVSLLYKEDIVEIPVNTLKIAILNLMPNKVTAETQILKLLNNPNFVVEVVFLYPITHSFKTTSIDYLSTAYKTFYDVMDYNFHGLIITGAPLEKIDFEAIDYWAELKAIMEFSKLKVKSTIHICWAACAGLYYHYNINKILVREKIFGLYPNHIENNNSNLLDGLNENLWIPQSRFFYIDKNSIDKIERLRVLISSETSGIHCITSRDYKQIFLTGHWEYDSYTLLDEYTRDMLMGLNPKFPKNYSCGNLPKYNWLEDAMKFFINWLSIISNQ